MNETRSLIIYSLLATIGFLGAVGDALLFRAASGPSRAWPLAGGFAVWMSCVALVYLYFRLGRHGFTSAVLVMIIVHAFVTAVIDWWYFGGNIGGREAVGFVLALAALIVLEGGAERQALRGAQE